MAINLPESITWKFVVIKHQTHARRAALGTLTSVVPEVKAAGVAPAEG